MRFALIAFHRAAKNSIAAAGTYIARLFVADPFFVTELSSIWNSAEDDFLAHRHGEIVNVLTGKIAALMTPGISFLFCALFDLTLVTMHEPIVRQAAAAPNVFNGKRLAIWKSALAGSSSLVKLYQTLLEFDVVVAVSDVNGADIAIKTTRRKEIGIDWHGCCPSENFVF